MQKRILIIASIAVLFLALAGTGFLLSKQSRSKEPEPKDRCYRALPPDAMLILHVTECQDLSNVFADTSAYIPRALYTHTGLDLWIPLLQQDMKAHRELARAEALISMHDAGKNTFGLLFCMALPSDFRDAFFADMVKRRSARSRDYHGQRIWQFREDDQTLYITLAHGLLLVSGQAVLIEASIRHLATGGSIRNEAGFERVLAKFTPRLPFRLFLRESRIQTLFSVFLGRPLQKYAPFCARQAQWLAWEGSLSGHLLDMKGVALTDGVRHFLHLVTSQEKGQVGAWDIFPATTVGMMAICFSDAEAWWDGYLQFLEVHKRKDRFEGQLKAYEKAHKMDVKEWFNLLYPQEVALGCVPFEGHLEWLTVIRSKFVSQAKLQFAVLQPQRTGDIYDNPVPEIPGLLFGPIFQWNPAQKYCFIGDYVVMGSEAILSFLQQQALQDRIFSLRDNVSHSPVGDALFSPGTVTLFVQPAMQTDSLLALADFRYREGLSGIKSYNTQYVSLQFRSEEGQVRTAVTVYGGSQTPPPYVRPLKVQGGSNFYAPDSLKRRRPPFRILNHATREYNEVTQKTAPDYRLRSIDSRNRLVWEYHPSGPVSDTLVQIDFLENNKLQSLFAVGNRLHLIDRIGREVSPYPAVCDAAVTYGPYVFDLNEDKQYRIFCFHADSSLRRYDKAGRPVASWQVYKVPGYVTGHLRPMRFNGKLYWAVYSSLQTAFLTDEGEMAGALMGDWSLDPKAEIVDQGKGIIRSVALNGKPVKLSLITGKMLKLK